MIYGFIIVLFVIAILIIIYTVNVTITLAYKIEGLNDQALITFSTFGGIIKYRIRLPRKPEEKRVEEEKKNSKVEGFFDKFRNLKEVYKTMLKLKVELNEKLFLTNLKLNIDFGAGDAFYSGIISGVIWAAAGILVAYLSETFTTFEKKSM